MNQIIFLFLLVSSFSLFGKDLHDFDPYQGKVTRELADARTKEYLVKDSQVEDYFEITEEAFILYGSPELKAQGKSGYVLSFGNGKLPKKSLAMKGLKIAIDPGHFGGSFSRFEERYIDIDYGNFPLQFNEGTLTLLTAYHLKELLEKEGAIVMMTKTEIGKGAYPQDFFDWLKEHPEVQSKSKPLSQLFRMYYNPLDLRARAEKINRFEPDIAIMIHFNAEDSVLSNSSKTKTTDKNFNVVFIPGAFKKEDLESEDARYEFLRLVATDDLEQSRALSEKVIGEFVIVLKVPPLTENNTDYMRSNSLKVSEGVYARNLSLTRLVHAPLCYGESLLQNNLQEALRLAEWDTVIHGIPCSNRLKEVARAYFEAIKEYVTDSNVP